MKKNNIEDEKYKEQCFLHLNKRWHFLDETRIELANTFDKYLLAFSTGSLYLSVLFTNNFNSNEALNFKYLLGVGWSLLITSTVLSLLSIYFSIFAYGKQMKLTKEKIDAIYEDKNYCEPINSWNIILSIFQILSVLFFILGITLLSIFYYINLK